MSNTEWEAERNARNLAFAESADKLRADIKAWGDDVHAQLMKIASTPLINKGDLS